MIWLEEFAPGQRYVSPRRRVDAAAIKAFAPGERLGPDTAV